MHFVRPGIGQQVPAVMFEIPAAPGGAGSRSVLLATAVKTLRHSCARGLPKVLARRTALACSASSIQVAEPADSKIGFIGLGIMGMPMVRREDRCRGAEKGLQPLQWILLSWPASSGQDVTGEGVEGPLSPPHRPSIS